MTAQYEFVTVDVFTHHRFGGNPWRWLSYAQGLTTEQMQNIAREFNYSETTFVLPPTQGGDFCVRIFTTTEELPFAGHPNIGTAIVLAQRGVMPVNGVFRFEELAGIVPVSVTELPEGGWIAELTAPEPLTRGVEVNVASVAKAFSIPVSAICVENHLPQVCSVGLPFLVVALDSVASLQNLSVDSASMAVLAGQVDTSCIHLYVRSHDDVDIRTRMFSPFDGLWEDPATGSANCALAALLADLDSRSDATLQYQIAQGVEMGRPSLLMATVQKASGRIQSVRIAGQAVLFSEGRVTL